MAIENQIRSANICFGHLTKKFAEVTAVSDFSFEAQQGEFITLLGPSGSGKTTILDMVAGFEKPTEGKIYINNRAVEGIPPFKRNIGMVFQNYSLFPHVTVFDNIAFPLQARRVSKEKIAHQVDDALKLVKLEGYGNRYSEETMMSSKKDEVRLKDSPQYYHEVLKRIPPRPFPAFEDEEMQKRVWGRQWGVFNDVGTLKMVLVHRPGDEIKVMTQDKYDSSIEALIDDRQQWYWREETPPDLEKMQEQHDAMVRAMQQEGVEVVYVDGAPRDPKAMFTRDNGIAVKGGAIIGRMGPVGEDYGTGRRGEEGYVTRRLADLGMPILRTIHGGGLFEGGSFAFLDEQTALIGMSMRQNEEAARQIQEVLQVQGVNLVRVPLVGYSLHIDGMIVMVDHKKALININRMPYWLLDLLKEKDIETIEVHHADSFVAINCLALAPGKVLYAIKGAERTAERLDQRGIKVINIDYTECQKNGGSIHCSTMPLIRLRD
jgi:N-dimethylarginine dimethylaminohydrolase